MRQRPRTSLTDLSDQQLHRRIVYGAWLVAIGFVSVYFSATFGPLPAYGLILAGAVLIGQGANMVIRVLMTEGMRLHRQ